MISLQSQIGCYVPYFPLLLLNHVSRIGYAFLKHRFIVLRSVGSSFIFKFMFFEVSPISLLSVMLKYYLLKILVQEKMIKIQFD